MANHILFYALCFLYVLSVATIAFDIVSFATTTTVSNNKCLFYILCANNWVGQNVTILYAIDTIQFTLFACCDFIAQSILVCQCATYDAVIVHLIYLKIFIQRYIVAGLCGVRIFVS
jgi:hypothetical protein